ncbi:ABC transporter substrate-binding protein [Hyphomicrobium sp. CS1BSMeth3]|uniref:ABC transporter substrate-binding protein n=1 Tax=Hyphomicrobium sp. CS1BSMeth3 TaxID=1892844 RepID=UPI0009316236|nr:ABC transporter substrate-binding protein [Hyphomicrobium sp. CS1BSMeth3]
MKTRKKRPNRRQVCSLLASGVAMPFVGLGTAFSAGAKDGEAILPALTLWGPPAGPSITLAHAISAGYLQGIAEKLAFKAWRNPDEMRAGLTSGTMQVVIVPTQVAANLFNRGLGVRLVNVMTDGLLYVIARDASLTTIAALRGKKVAVPFRNDTPEFIFRRLLMANTMKAGADLTVETTGTPIEAMQLLLAGRIDAAVVPEPAASAAIARGTLTLNFVTRVMDVQKLWREITKSDHSLPQAGLAVTSAFADKHPDIVRRLQAGLVKATASVLESPTSAAYGGSSALDLPWPILRLSIPWSNLVCHAARDARPSLEAMYAVIAEADASLLGGKLPAAEFYM